MIKYITKEDGDAVSESNVVLCYVILCFLYFDLA